MNLAGIQSQGEWLRLLAMAESMAGVGRWRFDLATGGLTWSDKVFDIHGVDPASFTPSYAATAALYHADDWPILDASVARARATGEGFTLNMRLVRPDGALRQVKAKGECVFGDDGAALAVIGVFQDVTDQVDALAAVEAARREAESKASRAAVAEELAGLGHWRVDYPGETLVWSDEMYVIYGFDRATPLTVEAALAMVHPDDWGLTVGRLENDLEYGPARDRPVIRIVRPNGDIRHVVGSTRIERGEDGSPTAMIGTLMDVTERTLAERELAESEARYRLLADNATDLITVRGMDNVIRYASPACRALGYAPEDMVGLSASDLIHPDDQARAQADRLSLAANQPLDPGDRGRYRIRRKDGVYVWLEGSPTVILDQAGQPSELLSVYRDVTARRRMEQDLVEARAEAEAAAAVKAEFLANMSHELRTPLTSILGFADLIGPYVEGEKGRRFLARIRDASQGLLSTVNDILDFSKLEAGQVEIEPRPTDLMSAVAAVTDLLAPQAAAKGLALSFSPARAAARAAWVDETRLRQVLLNLVGNAVKFTAEGRVEVVADYDPGAARLRVEVRDTGPGVPPERLGRLFQRFSQVDGSTTRQFGGTGLGLAICKGLIEAMGGRLGVDSAPGEGSVFWFELPAALVSAEVLDDSWAQAAPAGDLAGLRVLVVDDNSTNREIVRLYLGGLGAEVAEAPDGPTAIALAQARPFDLILMDLRMPIMDGAAAARRIREDGGPNEMAPILAFTADALFDLDSADQGLFDGYAAKPIEPAALFEAIDRVLAGPAATPSSSGANAV